MTAKLQQSPRDATAPLDASPVGVMARLTTAAGLLAGLRWHDLRAAKTMVKSLYGTSPKPSALPAFAAWTARQLLDAMPRGLRVVTFPAAIDRTPFWLTLENPLANHPWKQGAEELPSTADTVVIGAGMTGGSLAYHWSKAAPPHRSLVVLEMNDPASGASGRNGGSLVMGRYYAMVLKLLEDYWRKTNQHGDDTRRRRLGEKFAETYCAAAYRNAEMIAETIRTENFDCDYQRNGWIQLRSAEQQDALTESVELTTRAGFLDWGRVTPGDIERMSGVRCSTDAGISRRAGQYHPAKWVWCLLGRALQSNGVQLFTRTKVLRIVDEGEVYRVETDRGSIVARHVVNATEAYTAQLHRQFSGKLQPVQTQLCAVDAAPDHLKPNITVSSSLWFGERRGDRVILGSDETALPDENAGQNRPSRFITKFVLTEVQRFTGPFRMTVRNEWSGSVGFTIDQYPVVGTLDGKRQYVIGGMCGSGTGVAFNASRCIVNRILGRSEEQDDYPAEYFAPSRLLSPETHPWPDA
ncbi:MAG: FAD-dependent oxidoreductase [Alsobacter sp.]